MEGVVREELKEGGLKKMAEMVGRLRREARRQGLWNLFLPSESGLSRLDYTHLTARPLPPRLPPHQLLCLCHWIHLYDSLRQKITTLQTALCINRSSYTMTD